ncbi:MAG: GxxExxY protein [Phycisphaerales bacterium]|nr:GxxExxY protein [Phycisphaerales bacterium]
MNQNPQSTRRRSTPLADLDPALTEVSRKVIGCAIEVHKELGPGYPLEIYKKALVYEMKHEEVAAQEDYKIEVEFDGEVIGEVVADIYAGERFLVMLCNFYGEVGGHERSVLRAQLRAADLELGLIINFGQRRLKDGLVRVLNPDALRGDDDEDDEYEDEDED